MRIWWDEDRPDTVLQGEDGGAASDGRCADGARVLPWMASQLEALMREFTAAGLPLPKSDRGIQRVDQRLSDNGSGAYDVYLDGSSNDYSGARRNARGCSIPGRTVEVPDSGQHAGLRCPRRRAQRRRQASCARCSLTSWPTRCSAPSPMLPQDQREQPQRPVDRGSAAGARDGPGRRLVGCRQV